jgi:nitrite reductase/ring-hydroxylating ferredoxin subunit
MNSPLTEELTYVAVATLADLGEGGMKMVRVDGRRLCLIRLSTGVHAIDNACPHEGYGLTQGQLVGDQLTCVWHNWKFRVTDGNCTQGEENVTSHHVQVSDDGTISVALHVPQREALVPVLKQSLRNGIANDYPGQISRDVIRLLKADANPGELVWEAIEFGAPRAEYGWGHSIAAATDCLAIATESQDDLRVLPIVQGIATIADTERSRPVEPLPDPLRTLPVDAQNQFRVAVEEERLVDAQALLRAAIHAGMDQATLSAWFTSIVSEHHLAYGHGAIYSQKAFELLDMIGWDRADTVLPYLVPTIVYGTREDKLPYMRPFMRKISGAVGDFGRYATQASDSGWDGGDALTEALLGKDVTYAFDSTIAAFNAGASVDDVLDACVMGSSLRMLRYDTIGEKEFLDDFNWLDITHGVTYAHAARWHHHQNPSAQTARLALFSTFLTYWTGRHEWHTTVLAGVTQPALADDLHAYGIALQRLALEEPTPSPIHQVHAIKNSRAAAIESLRLNSNVPLLAAQRFVEAPKHGFLAATVARSVAFLNGRAPRD